MFISLKISVLDWFWRLYSDFLLIEVTQKVIYFNGVLCPFAKERLVSIRFVRSNKFLDNIRSLSRAPRRCIIAKVYIVPFDKKFYNMFKKYQHVYLLIQWRINTEELIHDNYRTHRLKIELIRDHFEEI